MNAPVQEPIFRSIDPGEALDIPLVDAEYGDENPRASALQIIADLKSYYRRRSHSHKERYGSEDPSSEAILQDLSVAYESAKQRFNHEKRGASGERVPRLRLVLE